MNKDNQKAKARSIASALVLLCAASIFYYSWLPSSNLKTETYLPQLIIEWTNEYLNLRTAVPFLLLGFLCEMRQQSASYYKERNFLSAGKGTIIISAVIVCLAEAGQFFISDRHPDFMDIFFGIAGGICGGTAALLFKKLNHYFFYKNA
ncbi:VanZ family protein [Flavobacterium chungbukense]|uniref:VanZ-like domain-containing protein n=1 Tax=Flavobacterium chungbukense TaxID=877464 RepID=A0ABP7Y6R1_9FLAO|nr:VanZ family protein [Flavobacterium chungbukense]MCC4923788.1 VanZ family protein [Flavobacterium chungbukense]